MKKQRFKKQRIKVGDFIEIYTGDSNVWKGYPWYESHSIIAIIYEIETKDFRINNEPYQIVKAYDITTNIKYHFDIRNSSIVLDRIYSVDTIGTDLEWKNALIRKKDL